MLYRMGIGLVQTIMYNQVVNQNFNQKLQRLADLIDHEVFHHNLVILVVNQIDFKEIILDFKIDTKPLVIEIFKEKMNIGVFVTQMFKIIQDFSESQIMRIGEDGIVIFRDLQIREFIGTLMIKGLVEIMDLSPGHLKGVMDVGGR